MKTRTKILLGAAAVAVLAALFTSAAEIEPIASTTAKTIYQTIWEVK